MELARASNAVPLPVLAEKDTVAAVPARSPAFLTEGTTTGHKDPTVVVPFAGDPLTLYVAALSPAETRLKVISLTSTNVRAALLATAVAVAGVKVIALVLTAVIVKLVVPSPATVN